MKDAILSIAAGSAQLPLLEAAGRLGFALVTVDRDARAPGMRLADACIVLSTHDPDGILTALEDLPEGLRLRAVATKSSGPPVTTAARIARALGLPGLHPAHAETLVSKPGMMELAERAGVAVPRHHACVSPEELHALEIEPPWIVKPSVTRVGKQGITRVDELVQLRGAFDEACAASADGRVEIEELVPGEDVVLAALFSGSRLHPLVLLDEQTDFGAQRRASGLGFALPSRHAGGPFEAALVAAATRMVHELELGDGVGFFSFRLHPAAGPVLIEAHFDLAGDFVADRLFRAACQLDPIEETLRLLSGEPWSACVGELRPAMIRFLFAEDLAHERDAKLCALRALDGLLDLEGERPASGCDARARVGYALLRCGSNEANEEAARQVDSILGRGPSSRSRGGGARARVA